MGIMALPIISNSTGCSTACSSLQRRNQLRSALMALCVGNTRSPMESLHKRPAMWRHVSSRTLKFYECTKGKNNIPLKSNTNSPCTYIAVETSNQHLIHPLNTNNVFIMKASLRYHHCVTKFTIVLTLNLWWMAYINWHAPYVGLNAKNKIRDF